MRDLRPKSSAQPALCTVTQRAGHGGIARVSYLISLCLRRWYGDRFNEISFLGEEQDHPTTWRKVNFISGLMQLELREKLDWMVFDHLQLAAVQNFLPRSRRRPYAIFLHGAEAWVPLSTLRKRALLNANVLMAPSGYSATRIRSVHPDLPRIHVCHLALPPELTSQNDTNSAEAETLSSLLPESVLIVARMAMGEQYKGHEQLLRAWPQVVSAVPHAQLVIVGTGDDLPRLKGIASEVGVTDQVFFTGRVSEETLNAIYSRVAVFAMPSTGEGFGVVYLEAMRHRLPCIGGASDGASEIIVHGKTGFLVDQTDICQLANHVIDLLSNARRRRKMGEAGHQRWLTRFSFENFECSFRLAVSNLMKADR